MSKTFQPSKENRFNNSDDFCQFYNDHIRSNSDYCREEGNIYHKNLKVFFRLISDKNLDSHSHLYFSELFFSFEDKNNNFWEFLFRTEHLLKLGSGEGYITTEVTSLSLNKICVFSDSRLEPIKIAFKLNNYDDIFEIENRLDIFKIWSEIYNFQNIENLFYADEFGGKLELTGDDYFEVIEIEILGKTKRKFRNSEHLHLQNKKVKFDLLIPEEVLRNSPQFVLIKNLQIDLSNLDLRGVDLSRADGEYIAAASTIEKLRKLIPNPEYIIDPEDTEIDDYRDDPDALFECDRDYDIFGASYTILWICIGDAEKEINTILKRLLEIKKVGVVHNEPQVIWKINESDLFKVYQDYVYRRAGWLGKRPLEWPEGLEWSAWLEYSEWGDLLEDRINKLPCGIEDDAWAELDELMWK